MTDRRTPGDGAPSDPERTAASATPWESADVQLARVRQFVLGDIAAAVAGLCLLSVFYAVWRPGWAYPMIGAVLISLAVLVFSLRLLRDGKLSSAIFAIAASFWFVIPTVTFVLPPAFASFALGTIWPVLLSTPYVDRRTLQRMAGVTLVVALGSLALSFRGDPYEVEDTIGTTVLHVSLLGIGLAFVVLTLVMILAYNSRLQGTLSDLSRSNARLLESERSLERKVASRTDELESASAYLRAVIENLPQGLITLDQAGNVLEINPAFARQFGEYAALEGLDGLPEEVRSVVVASAALGESPSEFVALADERIGKATATPITVASEHGPAVAVGSVVVVDDVTEERQIDRMKTDFISTVSHELRTPLTSVLGFARIIQKRLDDKIFPLVDREAAGAERAMRQVDDNLAIILSEGGRLTNLINDVLDISKMEAREVSWDRRPLEVTHLVETAVQATSALFADRPVDVWVDLDPGLPTIVGDEQRLVQVLINLLSNANKFTDEGSVTISARATRLTDGGAGVEIDVADTGIGVAAADMALLFERFRQVGDSLTDRPKGTGLGLPICREIVEAHGGTVDAESVLGEGTTFRVVLPLDLPGDGGSSDRGLSPGLGTAPTGDASLVDAGPAGDHEAGADAATDPATDRSGTALAPASAVGPTVLVVDDDAGVRALLRDLFESEQYEVVEADDGTAAVELASRVQPDLVTMDVLMPGLSGIDTALALRTNVRTAAIPLVFVSVLDRLDGVPLGYDGHITKPIDAEALLSTAAELIARDTGRDTGVLVVDATADVLQVVVAGLDRFGYEPVDPVGHDDDGRVQLVIANAELDQDRPVLDRWRFRREDHELLIVAYDDGNGGTRTTGGAVDHTDPGGTAEGAPT